MICSGEPVSAEKAVALGLAFDAVPADRLVEEGVRLVEYLQRSGDWNESPRAATQPLGLSDDQMTFAFAVAEGAIKAKTEGPVPGAPGRPEGDPRRAATCRWSEGLKAEQQAALELVGSPTSANLIGVFFMQNRLERDPGVADAGVKPRTVHRVGVARGRPDGGRHRHGARPLGHPDGDGRRRRGPPRRRPRAAERGRRRAGSRSAARRPRTWPRCSRCSTRRHRPRVFADCDVVIEAITEDEAAKTAIYRAARRRSCKTTRSWRATRRRSRSPGWPSRRPHPERFVGMHFFHPVDRMELVEVIRGEKTSDETVATLVALAKRIRKTPIVVRDCPGFLVNRVLFPYMNEALLLLAGGGVDGRDRRGGRPSSGCRWARSRWQDLVGLDTAAYAGQVLRAAYPDRAVPTPILGDAGRRPGGSGKKSGAGFRKYAGKGKAEADPAFAAAPGTPPHRAIAPPTDEEITDRLFLPMLLEATRVLEEGIVREPADVDMGLILGIGFPPFRGGILRWADARGGGRDPRAAGAIPIAGQAVRADRVADEAGAARARRSIRGRRSPRRSGARDGTLPEESIR